MYATIEQNITKLLDYASYDRHIRPYIDISKKFDLCGATDPAFQAEYRKYWAMNAAKLSDDFRTGYFDLLQNYRTSGEKPTVCAVAEELNKLQIKTDGNSKLHFSFATKLAHTLDPQLPVYDALVERFFLLPAAYTSKDFNMKLRRREDCYEFLRREFTRIEENDLLKRPIRALEEKFPEIENDFSFTKKIDTLIWLYVKMMRNGKHIRNRNIHYS